MEEVTATSELVKVANQLVTHAQACGLQLYCKNITKGDGSCWFNAIIDQLQRLSDRIGVCEEILSTENPAASLRSSVCKWMQNSKQPRVIQFRSKKHLTLIIHYWFDMNLML